jgi:hypothetical protein
LKLQIFFRIIARSVGNSRASRDEATGDSGFGRNFTVYVCLALQSSGRDPPGLDNDFNAKLIAGHYGAPESSFLDSSKYH